jgi:hypothetical protein
VTRRNNIAHQKARPQSGMSQYNTEEYPPGEVQKTTRQQHVSLVMEEKSVGRQSESRRNHRRRIHHINVRWNVHIDRLALIDFGPICNANKPDEFGFDVPQSEIPSTTSSREGGGTVT